MSAPSTQRGAAGRRLGWTAIALVAGAIALGGCGDDDEPETTTGTTSTTENTPTGTTTSTSTTTGETTTSTSTDTSGSGGTSSGGSSYDPEEDREGNDIPPPEGSPAEEFEEQCEKNPGAC